MNLQVLPLRVLVSRQVITGRMDYTGYLAGKTKSEMDILDRLAGRFVVQASELTVERFLGGGKLPAEEWERRRSEIPGILINFLDGTEEISINYGARTWVISDVDGVEKCFLLRSSGRMLGDNHWIHFDYFVEDGNLITALKIFKIARSKLALDHWASGPLDLWTNAWLWIISTRSAQTSRVILSGSSTAACPSPISRLQKLCRLSEFQSQEKNLFSVAALLSGKFLTKSGKFLQEGKDLFQYRQVISCL